MVEEQIIKLFCADREYYSKYYKYVNLNYIKTNYTSHYKLFNSIDSYYNTYDDKQSISTDELELQYKVDSNANAQSIEGGGLIAYLSNNIVPFPDMFLVNASNAYNGTKIYDFNVSLNNGGVTFFSNANGVASVATNAASVDVEVVSDG